MGARYDFIPECVATSPVEPVRKPHYGTIARSCSCSVAVEFLCMARKLLCYFAWKTAAVHVIFSALTGTETFTEYHRNVVVWNCRVNGCAALKSSVSNSAWKVLYSSGRVCAVFTFSFFIRDNSTHDQYALFIFQISLRPRINWIQHQIL